MAFWISGHQGDSEVHGVRDECSITLLWLDGRVPFDRSLKGVADVTVRCGNAALFILLYDWLGSVIFSFILHILEYEWERIANTLRKEGECVIRNSNSNECESE